MHFSANASPHRSGNSNDDQQPFEMSQYTPLGIQHFSAQYRNDPKVLEKLSKRICARVEQDSSELIAFCDKKIRKRRKKKKQEDDHQHEQSEPTTAPEVVSASDLLLGACLGQGSFSSVFVLEKHFQNQLTPATPAPPPPRRGRRGKQGNSSHHRSVSNRSASYDQSNSNNSTSNRSSTRTGRSKTPSLRRKLRQKYKNCENDGSNRSETNSSQRSRSLSLTRSKSKEKYLPIASGSPTKVNSKAHRISASGSISGESPKSTRSRSLSASIRHGFQAVFRGGKSDKDGNSHYEDYQDEEVDICESPVKTSRMSKSHHIRSNNDEGAFEKNHSGRGLFKKGKSRSVSCSRRRRSRRSRSRGSEGGRISETEKTADTTCTDDFSVDSPSKSNRGDIYNEGDLVVKVLQPKLMNQPKLFANCAAGLIREGLFLAAIDHPHVLKVHAWTSPNGWMDFAALSSKEGDLYDGYLLVLERLKGGSLKKWIRQWHQEYVDEERAIAAVAAMEAAEDMKRSERSRRSRSRSRLGLPRTLSFTTSSHGSAASFSFGGNTSQSGSSSRLRHTILKRRSQSQINSEDMAAAAPLLGSSHYDSIDSNERQFPYTTKWPKTQLADRASLLMQLSDTVKYLHKHRILHRDLKPDNLGVTFVDPRSNSHGRQKQYPSSLSLKIFDFDIARLVPEDPKVVKELGMLSSSKKKKLKRVSSSGSVQSFDPEILNENSSSNKCSNRSGRSLSPLRSCSSLSGEKQDNSSRRRKKGKYRGQRPRPGASVADTLSTYGTDPDAPLAHSLSEHGDLKLEGDTLFEMTAKMGSPRYMAPEIARNEPYNLRSEVYTVCLLIHEVLTLQKPYDELAPEDHGKLVHFDLPGYRPPVFTEWNWPTELEDVLHKGWGEISQRPSMKEVHSVLKRALPKLCPELVPAKTPLQVVVPSTTALAEDSVLITQPLDRTPQKEPRKKGRNLFHRTPKKCKSKRSSRSSSLTPTASNSDFSLSYDEPLAVDVAQ